jgi:hypothetical protein
LDLYSLTHQIFASLKPAPRRDFTPDDLHVSPATSPAQYSALPGGRVVSADRDLRRPPLRLRPGVAAGVLAALSVMLVLAGCFFALAVSVAVSF